MVHNRHFYCDARFQFQIFTWNIVKNEILALGCFGFINNYYANPHYHLYTQFYYFRTRFWLRF